MRLRELFEGHKPHADAAFCFGRFNPAHQGHIEVWKAVQQAGHEWFVGTNPTTHGANDPLPFNVKSDWMEAIYPEINGHIVPEQSVVTLASSIFKRMGAKKGISLAYVTDMKDWQWAGKLLQDYNGKQGPHGFYNFERIIHIESPRVSSATDLRNAARAGDEQSFYAASGTDPNLRVGGKSYYDTVVEFCNANPEKIKKDPAAKKPAVKKPVIKKPAPADMSEPEQVDEKFHIFKKFKHKARKL